VTEVAANPTGTGPPDGTATVDVLAAVADAAGAEEAAPLAAGAVAELAPPDPADPLDGAGEVAAASPPDPELAAPQAVSATAASRAPHASPIRDVRNDVFMRSPSAAEASYGYGDVPAGLTVTDI
jgi:hypothetical protein